jgi:hypothetical protein
MLGTLIAPTAMNGDSLLRLPPSYARKDPRVSAGVRVSAGGCHLLLAGVLYLYDRRGWWRRVFVAAARSFYGAYRLHRLPRTTSARTGASVQPGDDGHV